MRKTLVGLICDGVNISTVSGGYGICTAVPPPRTGHTHGTWLTPSDRAGLVTERPRFARARDKGPCPHRRGLWGAGLRAGATAQRWRCRPGSQRSAAGDNQDPARAPGGPRGSTAQQPRSPWPMRPGSAARSHPSKVPRRWTIPYARTSSPLGTYKGGAAHSARINPITD